MLLHRHDGPLTLHAAGRALVLPLSAVSLHTDQIFWGSVERFIRTFPKLVKPTSKSKDEIPSTLSVLRSKPLVSFDEAVTEVYDGLAAASRIEKTKEYFRRRLLNFISDMSSYRTPVVTEQSEYAPQWRPGGAELIARASESFVTRFTVLTTAPEIAGRHVLQELYRAHNVMIPRGELPNFTSTLEFDRTNYTGEFYAAAANWKVTSTSTLVVLAHSPTVALRAFDQGVRHVVVLKGESDPLLEYLDTLADSSRPHKVRAANSNHKRLDVISDLSQLQFR